MSDPVLLFGYSPASRELDGVGEVAAAAATHAPVFTGGKRIYETEANANTVITGVTLPPGVPGTFQIQVKITADDITVGIPAAWVKQGRTQMSKANGAYNKIQADFDSNGRVVYTIVVS